MTAPGRPAIGWAQALGVVVAVVALDQITKAAVRANLARGESHDILPGVDLVNVRNPGIAFGLFTDHPTLLGILTVAALGILLVYFATHATRPWLWLATGLMLGGALGNLVDRLRFGAVTDFVDVALWPAFNLADAAITIGVIALLLAIESRRERRR